MKKMTIILAIVFAVSSVCFITSVILTTGFDTNMYFAIIPGGFKGGNRDYELKDGYSNIEINISSSKAVIKQSKDDFTRVTYKASTSPVDVTAEIINDTLYVKEKWRWAFLTFFNGNGELIIEIPQREYDNVLLKVSSGSLKTESTDIDCLNLDLKISSGSMKVNGINSDEYTINCSSGGLTLDNASGKGEVKVSSGSVTVNYTDWNNSLNARISSGKLVFNLPKNAGMKVNSKVSSGWVKYNLNGDSGKIGTTDNARFGGDNVQEVTVKVSSGSISFNN